MAKVETRAVHPESVGFPTENGEILSIFFLKSKASEGLQGLGYWSHRFFPNLGD